jgi:hypothetical protein
MEKPLTLPPLRGGSFPLPQAGEGTPHGMPLRSQILRRVGRAVTAS